MNAVSLPASARDIKRLSAWRKFIHEPLLHFVLAGAAIFVVAHVIADSKRDTASTIILDGGLHQRLADLYSKQFGVKPTAAQLQVIVDDYLDDEVLYREALQLGLDGDDEIVRRRLIQKLEFLQRDTVSQAQPAPEKLRAYYTAHVDRFTNAARVTFDQLYFDSNRGGEAKALERAKHAHDELLHGRLPRDTDSFPLESDFTALTRDDAARVFGASNLVDSLFDSRSSEWSAPVRSGFGWHLVKVTAFEAPRAATFEEVLPEVRREYLQEEVARARRERLDALRARYHVAPRGAGQ
jgi:peptidyl-prolyl cis-trans isomerase C